MKSFNLALNKKLSFKHNSAFTIVELLIVIVIIGILASITIVSFSGITNQANIATVQSDLNSNGRKLQLYFTQYGSYPTTLDGSQCPTAPVNDTNYCIKLSSGNTLTSYSGSSSTFTLITSKGSLVYQITPDIGPTKILPFNLATGGNTTVDVTNYNSTGQTWRVHTFTANGSLNVIDSYRAFRVLVVGGGGGGAYRSDNDGGGFYHVGNRGGGGEVLEDTRTLTAGARPIVVGNGGGNNSSGSPSSIDTYTARAGLAGNGGTYPSIGGASGNGNAGGNSPTFSAGGGGAGGPGNSTTNGPGISSNITGTSVSYGAGGAAGINSSGPAGSGGNGGTNPSYPVNGIKGVVIVAYQISGV